MRDGRVIELPPDLTAAQAARLEAEGAAAQQHLGRRPAPGAAPDLRPRVTRAGGARTVVHMPAVSAPRIGPGRIAGARTAGLAVQSNLGGGRVAEYLSARARPVLASGVAKLATLSRHEQTHANAGQKLHQAERAVVIPASEGHSNSNLGQVQAVAGRPAPAVDGSKASRELQESLARNIPRSIEDVDNFKRDRKAQHTGADVLKMVQADTTAVLQTFSDIEHTPPPAAPEHRPEGLLGAEAAPPTPVMNLGHGAIAPLLPEHTALNEYAQSADAKLREEGITQQQLDMVNSGDLAEANWEKKGLDQAARSQPAQLQGFARAEATRVETDLQHQERTERAALSSKRAHGLGLAAQQQRGAKAGLEKKRDEIATKINGIYTAAQASVKKKLADLETLSLKRFDEGNERAARTFEDDVNRELDAYEDDRYSGWFGWARKAKDWLLGMDDLPRVKEIFETNRDRFVGTINKLVADITADNHRVIQECRDELTKARTDIKTLIDRLGPELKDVGDKSAHEIGTKLDELDRFVQAKEADLQQKLADRQQAAIKSIDDKIEKMKEALSGALAKLGRLLLGAAKKFFAWALGQFGYSLDDIEPVIDKGVAVLKAIFIEPIQFVKHLVGAAVQGFRSFGRNFLTHLKDSVFDWLTGSLEGIVPPAEWDLRGIVGVALQMLGLTWTNIRGKLVRLVGEPGVKAMEAGFDLVVSLIRDGPIAAWEKLKEMAGEITQAFVGGVKDFVKIRIVERAIETIGAMLVPGAGMIRAIIGIYDAVVFFIQKAKQIIEIIGNFLSSIGDIAAGNIGSAADALEKGLARGFTLVINFLARFLHLDGITARIRSAIQHLYTKVDGMLDRVAEWIAGKARGLVAKGGPAEQRLDEGLDAAQKALDRFAGSRVGRAVLSPVLSAVRLRYGLTSLDLLNDEGFWAVEGVINPTRRGPRSRARVDQDGMQAGIRSRSRRWIGPPTG